MLLHESSQEPLEETDMQIRPQSWVYLAAFAISSAGCTTLSTTSSDPRTARLPTGVTLLDSNRDQCAGSIAIDATSFAGARRSDLVLQRGENATFELDTDVDDNDDLEVEWTCVGTGTAERESTDCPDDTSYVRITRESTGNDFLLECYGDRDRDVRDSRSR
jgi:hypothetical protein